MGGADTWKREQTYHRHCAQAAKFGLHIRGMPIPKLCVTFPVQALTVFLEQNFKVTHGCDLPPGLWTSYKGGRSLNQISGRDVVLEGLREYSALPNPAPGEGPAVGLCRTFVPSHSTLT